MPMRQYIQGLAVVAALANGAACASPVVTCDQVTNAQPSKGAKYRGLVVNDDYHMGVRIPDGMTAWGAAVFPDGTGAPFHGFALFPAEGNGACTVVNIGWRVQEDEAPQRPPQARTVIMRGATAWTEDANGLVGGQSMFNRTVTFSAPVGRSVADGSVQIVGPASDRDRLITLGDQIVRSMVFHP